MKVRLEVAHSKANVKRVVLTRDAVIGRSPDCNLRIAAGQVSRKHCTMLVSDRGVFIRDNGSSNGTFLGERRLEPNVDVPVPPGAQLNIGGVRFLVRYELEGDEAAIGGSTVHRSTADTLEPQRSPLVGVPVEEIEPADAEPDDDDSSVEVAEADEYEEYGDAEEVDEARAFESTAEFSTDDDGMLPLFEVSAEDDDDLTEADPEEPTVNMPVGVTSPSDFEVNAIEDEDGDDDIGEFLRNLDD